MKAWFRDIIDALLLRSTALARVASRPDAFLRGFLVILAVGLVAGLPEVVGDVVRGFGAPAVIEPSDVQLDLVEPLAAIRAWMHSSGLPQGMIDQILVQIEENVRVAGSIAAQVQLADTILPRPLAQGFIALGAWLSRPFANSSLPLTTVTLATWLGYGVWVMLAAKLLGGRGSLHGFFGSTAFFTAPHLLTILSPVPVVGGILGIIAFLWGLIIYTAATAASHRLSMARAVLAVFLPVVALLTVMAFLVIPIGLLTLFSIGSR
jgi:hypothetical protein